MLDANHGDGLGVELSIIAPMYNEAANVERTVNLLLAALAAFGEKWEVIFVNDGSTDSTLEVANSWAEKVEQLRVVSYDVNFGRGRALRTGFEHAKGKYVVTIDFDLSYSPDHIIRIYETLKNDAYLDIVLGSAYMHGGRVEGVPVFRHLLSRVGNLVIRTAFESKYYTYTCVLRGYRREVLEALDLESDGKEIHLEVLSRAIALGCRIKEIPATLRARRAGRSKFRFGATSVSHLLFTIFQRPSVLFAFFGILIMMSGVILGLARYVWHYWEVSPFIPVILVLFGTQVFSFSIVAAQNSFIRDLLYRAQARLKQIEAKVEGTEKVGS